MTINDEHVIFDLGNNDELRYMDTRKFGKMYLIKKDDIDNIGPLKELGLEVEVSGKGEKVTDQLPKQGIQINSGTKVTIYLK